MEHAHKIARKHLQTSSKRQAENFDAKLVVTTIKSAILCGLLNKDVDQDQSCKLPIRVPM